MERGLFEEIKDHMAEPGVRPREGTNGDATIQPPGMEAPSSIQNQQGERIPEMWRLKKGNQYHFRMKLHIGVDAEKGIVHSLSAISAKVQDMTEAHRLLYGGRATGVGRCWVHRGAEARGAETGREPGAGRGLAGGSIPTRNFWLSLSPKMTTVNGINKLGHKSSRMVQRQELVQRRRQQPHVLPVHVSKRHHHPLSLPSPYQSIPASQLDC